MDADRPATEVFAYATARLGSRNGKRTSLLVRRQVQKEMSANVANLKRHLESNNRKSRA